MKNIIQIGSNNKIFRYSEDIGGKQSPERISNVLILQTFLFRQSL